MTRGARRTKGALSSFTIPYYAVLSTPPVWTGTGAEYLIESENFAYGDRLEIFNQNIESENFAYFEKYISDSLNAQSEAVANTYPCRDSFYACNRNALMINEREALDSQTKIALHLENDLAISSEIDAQIHDFMVIGVEFRDFILELQAHNKAALIELQQDENRVLDDTNVPVNWPLRQAHFRNANQADVRKYYTVVSVERSGGGGGPYGPPGGGGNFSNNGGAGGPYGGIVLMLFFSRTLIFVGNFIVKYGYKLFERTFQQFQKYFNTIEKNQNRRFYSIF